jgi:hypothetical protein
MVRFPVTLTRWTCDNRTMATPSPVLNPTWPSVGHRLAIGWPSDWQFRRTTELVGKNGSMNTQQRIDRMEDALVNLGTIIEADGRWVKSENSVVQSFGAQFNRFVEAVAHERAAKS